ncbi:phage virion morphogenesis protein [Ornithobacterium rhinotracheale]|uniref:phage virion morphogenesis protein n=1 Tax=Ornithobacterium rhinotracheale TaxID=28251 RepID=UPI001FF1DC88|nr:phage virion morphogenesis protein [Ornithobacterium rhinotracheale]MCK0203365.1 phage virion morphogenesis protein [Ornithobacterium rhinotracheale]
MTAEEYFNKLQNQMAQTLRELPPIIGEEALHFAQDNFDKQAYNGEDWQPRKNPTKWGKKDEEGRALLVKTGKLRRSVRVGYIDEEKVTVVAGGADVPYAKAHNEGFRGIVEQNVSPHLRKGKKGKDIYVKEHKRTIFQNIPKRQFIGDEASSPELAHRIKQVTIEHIKKSFKP